MKVALSSTRMLMKSFQPALLSPSSEPRSSRHRIWPDNMSFWCVVAAALKNICPQWPERCKRRLARRPRLHMQRAAERAPWLSQSLGSQVSVLGFPAPSASPPCSRQGALRPAPGSADILAWVKPGHLLHQGVKVTCQPANPARIDHFPGHALAGPAAD